MAVNPFDPTSSITWTELNQSNGMVSWIIWKVLVVPGFGGGSLKTGKLVPLPPLPVDTEKVRYSANYLLIRRKLVNEIRKFAWNLATLPFSMKKIKEIQRDTLFQRFQNNWNSFSFKKLSFFKKYSSIFFAQFITDFDKERETIINIFAIIIQRFEFIFKA